MAGHGFSTYRIAQASPNRYRSLTGSWPMIRRSVSEQTSARRLPSIAQLENDSCHTINCSSDRVRSHSSAIGAAGWGSLNSSVPRSVNVSSLPIEAGLATRKAVARHLTVC